MNWFDLGNPRPLPAPDPYIPIVWPDGEAVPLPAWQLRGVDELSFAQLVARRRTRRSFGKLKSEHLGALLDLSCRVHQTGEASLQISDYTPDQRLLPAPSIRFTSC